MISELHTQDELKKLLVENQRLLIENNQMLHKMRRSAKNGEWVRVLSFLVLIAIPLGIYLFYVKPSFEQIQAELAVFEQARTEASDYQDWYDPAKMFK